jgi:hypothetical protein
LKGIFKQFETKKASSFLNISFPQRRFENLRRNAPDLARFHNSCDLRIQVESHQTAEREVEFTNPIVGMMRFSVERENESDCMSWTFAFFEISSGVKSDAAFVPIAFHHRTG